MKLIEYTGDPFVASINGAPPSTVRQHLETYKVTDDDSMKELAEAMHKGRDVVMQIPTDGGAYVMVREMLPSNIAMPASPGLTKGLPKPPGPGA